MNSISRQTMSDLEVIVVDDGSTDGGPERVRAYTDPRVRLVHQPNLGPGAARNTGCREARTSVVAFLDGDDEWESRFLEKSLNQLEASGVGLVAHAWWDDPGSVYPEWAKRWPEGEWQANPRTPVQELISRLAFCSPCTVMLRREIWERYGGFYERNRCRYAEDAHLFLKVLLNEPVWMGHEALARFHREDSSLSGNYRAVRPVEPFLQDREDVKRVCPEEMSELLDQFLTTRAMKTALVLGYWGHWREAGQLRAAFPHAKAAQLPWFWSSRLASHPATGWLVGCMGRLHRAVKR